MDSVVVILIVIFALFLIIKGVNIVPQSKVYVVEIFGKYKKLFKRVSIL
jgi:regulator of protease activity HflC (stomatin/prohibitin superfamily)